MPSRVKLLNAQAAGVTGPTIKIGMGQPSYVIRVQGGFTLGGGAAGTQGVNIETSPDDGVTWVRDVGMVGGENVTETSTEVAELVDLPDKTVAYIEHYAKHIRARTGSGMVGSATVWMEMER